MSTIAIHIEDAVALVTLDRPDVMNAMHSPAHFEMDEAVNAYDQFDKRAEGWTKVILHPGQAAGR